MRGAPEVGSAAALSRRLPGWRLARVTPGGGEGSDGGRRRSSGPGSVGSMGSGGFAPERRRRCQAVGEVVLLLARGCCY